jgi:hypothetical protein
MADRERLKDFEIMFMDSQMLIDELIKEIEKEDYDLDYIRDLVNYGHFDIDCICSEEYVYDIYEEYTFLIKAANLNKSEIVKTLLENGADPNVQNNLGRTALMAGLHWNHLQVVEELLKHPKINPNLQNLSNHSNALMYAGYNLQAIQMLLECPNIDPNNQRRNIGDNALIEAIRYAQYDIIDRLNLVQALLKHPKTDPNIKGSNGNTAFHWASQNGLSQAIEALLKHPSIDVTITNRKGDTAWDLATPEIREQFPQLNPINHILKDKEIETLKTLLEKVSAKLPENSKNLQKIQDLLS